MKSEEEVQKNHHRTHYIYRSYGPTYSEKQQLLMVSLTVKQGETKKITFFKKHNHR